MKYLVTGATITNDILYADGSRADGFLGGALYALNGVKPYCDDVLLVTTAGPDFEDVYGDYYRANGLSFDGVEKVLPRTRYNYLEYSPDGRWIEYSKYGPDFDAACGGAWAILPEYVAKRAGADTKGIYIESGVTEPIWQGIPAIREKAPNAKIMWELDTSDTADPGLRTRLLSAIREHSDIFSINLPESKDLFGTADEAESVDAILRFGVPCFFRVGPKGAYMIADGRAWFAGSVGADESVDSTGCGNCSTGAAMYGFCEGFHPLKTVLYANYAAGLNAAQTGPYPLYTKELRGELLDRIERRFAELMQEEN
ncbi:MAG: carbohydrate kinase family protein [Oscillospiraceae bacterium]|nr:carbohydrate kinase family protein [Oscillospiraceae bacterium]